MDKDRFTAVKAILDGINKSVNYDEDRYFEAIKGLRAALVEIAAIQHQPTDLGCRLAVSIAETALAESDWP